MPRTRRAAVGGVIYHVLNRGNGRMQIFRKPGDYRAFVGLMIDAKQRAAVDVFGYCLMPNHWHIILRPAGDTDLAAYFSWLTNTHVKRYRSHYQRTSGHLYQGRFKSFPVQEQDYFLSLTRYVEANPLRAKLVTRAQDWPWSSLACDRDVSKSLLAPWPVPRPSDWAARVNQLVDASAARRLTTSFERSQPFGSPTWTSRTASQMGIEHTIRPRGRPKKEDSK